MISVRIRKSICLENKYIIPLFQHYLSHTKMSESFLVVARSPLYLQLQIALIAVMHQYE